MPEVSMNIVIRQLLSVLREGFEGPPESWSYFTDNNRNAGFFGTLAKVDAENASLPLSGTTIAAHVHHVIFGLNASSAWIRGERNPLNWHESWRINEVDDATWEEMLEQLSNSYKNLQQAVQSHASISEEAMGGAIGAIAHIAYHLGAIKQKILFVQKE